MQYLFVIFFGVGNPGKISKRGKAFLRVILSVISRERKVVEGSTLVKVVIRFVRFQSDSKNFRPECPFNYSTTAKQNKIQHFVSFFINL